MDKEKKRFIILLSLLIIVGLILAFSLFHDWLYKTTRTFEKEGICKGPDCYGPYKNNCPIPIIPGLELFMILIPISFIYAFWILFKPEGILDKKLAKITLIIYVLAPLILTILTSINFNDIYDFDIEVYGWLLAIFIFSILFLPLWFMYINNLNKPNTNIFKKIYTILISTIIVILDLILSLVIITQGNLHGRPFM